VVIADQEMKLPAHKAHTLQKGDRIAFWMYRQVLRQSKIGNPKSKIGNPKSKIGNPKSAIQSPKSAIQSPKWYS
jgi:hypothetical protein